VIGSQTQSVDPTEGSGVQTVSGGQSPSQEGQGDWSQESGRHSQNPPAALAWQNVPGGQSPSQLGKGDWSHDSGGGSQRHELIPLSGMQVWPEPGQGPSQAGYGDWSQVIGSQMHWVDPTVGSGTQTSSGGQSPSHAGQGERSQITCAGVQ
jgi:hypothetical protein